LLNKKKFIIYVDEDGIVFDTNDNIASQMLLKTCKRLVNNREYEKLCVSTNYSKKNIKLIGKKIWCG